MERVRDTASKRQFEGFAAGAADALFRTGYLMTGDPRDAEDLVQPGQHRVKVTINPAAMPAGTKLSYGHFQLASSQQTSIALIDTGSYTCTSTVPTALPSGGALLRYSGGAS